MPGDIRHKDVRWNLGERPDWAGANLAVLMDIRDELKKLNALLHCTNFLGLPGDIRSIKNRLTCRRRRRKLKA